MSSTILAAQPGGPFIREVHQIARSIPDLSKVFGNSLTDWYSKCNRHSVAFLDFGPGTKRILNGDWQRAVPAEHSGTVAMPPHGYNGRNMLAAVFPNFEEFSLLEVGVMLGLNPKTLRRFISDDVLPAYRSGPHWRMSRTGLFVRLLELRVPARWEVAEDKRKGPRS